MMYGEKQKQKSLRKEDIGFVQSLRPLAGWNPLTENEKAYKNPLIKYEFYQDILNQLGMKFDSKSLPKRKLFIENSHSMSAKKPKTV